MGRGLSGGGSGCAEGSRVDERSTPRFTYLSGPHTLDRHRIALDYFDQQWKALKFASGCGGAVLGAAGRRCIDHRARYGKWPWEIQSADG